MLLCCLAYGGMTSCSGKKSDADEQDKGVSTVLPDSKNEVTVQTVSYTHLDVYKRQVTR